MNQSKMFQLFNDVARDIIGHIEIHVAAQDAEYRLRYATDEAFRDSVIAELAPRFVPAVYDARERQLYSALGRDIPATNSGKSAT